MEELNNKLHSGNPVVVAHIIFKLINNIKQKQLTDNLETAELKFLKQKCVNEDNAVSIVASDAILQIVRAGNQSLVKSVLADFITIITTTKCSSNIAFLINNLLLIDLEKELSVDIHYKSLFNLRLPQHPFIVMLNENPNSWPTIFKEITYTYRNSDENIISHYTDLYKPVFLYTLCNPQENSFSTFNQKLWTFIIHNEKENTINCLLSWLQFECKDNIQVNSDFLIELSDLNITRSICNQNVILLWQISTLHQLILNKFDPRAMIFSIANGLQHYHDDTVLNSVLLILAKAISLSPSVHLFQLLKLCKLIISQTKCDLVTQQIMKSSLLLWITNPTSLTSEALLCANATFLSMENGHKNSVRTNKGYIAFTNSFEKLINTNSDVYLSLQLYSLLESWRNDRQIICWLEKLEKAPVFFITKIINFLFGLFLNKFSDKEINIKVFGLLLKCVDYNKRLAMNVLTVILYKLTNVVDSELHYQLIKAIPKMGVMKDNLQKIVSTIHAINKGPNTLKTFSVTLMLDLWKVENKCYPYLENMLITPFNSQCDKWEFYITRAHILKELCALKPELYGKEMVAHLSTILNECNNPDGAIACALAIDGITLLCKFEIIDAVTTWATLAPMFKNETRIPVIKSLCSLISEVPNLSYTENYPKLIEEVVSKLWEYTVLNADDEIWEAALSALTSFSLEEIVAQMPDEYLDEETLNLKKAGHVVPGYCWIQFLKNCGPRLEVVGDFLIKLVSLEISNYLKFVYQVKGTREPVDYSYLPTNSVVRGLSTYIQSKMMKWKGGIYKEVYLQCLRIFSQEYSKPLPPLDWCFLQELVHEQEAKNFCISIAAHQVVLSGTARRFMVNYIEAVTENHTNENDVLNIYSNLKHLANSVQPFTLKPFLLITISDMVELFKNGNEVQFLTIIKHLKDTLQNQNIQESNKVVIAEIINDLVNETDISSRLFEVLLECIALFPLQCINDISCPKTIKEIRNEWLRKAIKIRCYTALNHNDAPLNWLNELMEVGGSFPTVTPFMFEHFAEVFQKHKDNTDCVLWVLELIGQIQAMIAEKFDEKQILFLCNVFILATIVFSGHFVFLDDFSSYKMNKLFPRAIATLLDVNHWSICTIQALEWFYHMNAEKIFHTVYGDMFVQCLQSLRHEAEFHKNMKWTKYLNSEC